MANHRKTKGRKVAIAGTTLAAAVSIGLTPTVANAVSSNTYFIGFPEWLPIGSGNTLPSDPDAIEDAMLAAQDTNPIVGWGTGGVALNPQWVTWYNPNLDPTTWLDPTKDQYYTPRQWGETGTQEVMVDNPAYKEAYDAALAQVMQEDRDTILASDTIDLTLTYTVPEPTWWTKKYLGVSLATVFGSWTSQKIAGQPLSAPITTTVTVANPFKDDPEKLDQFLETGTYEGTYEVVVDPVQALGLSKPSWVPNGTWNSLTNSMKPINVGNVDYGFDRTKFGLPGASWDERAEELVDPNIPKQVPETQPVMGWIPGGWTTNTFGQWVSPTDDITGLQDLNLSGLLSGNMDLGSLSGLSNRDLAYYLSGDLGFLAPLLNWTTYIQNVNLIAYGDGAIATGEAYRRFIEAVRNGEIKAGEPQTDGRYLVITTDENGNPVVKEVNHTVGNGGVDEIISSYPLPGDLVYPGMPVDPETGQPTYPSYTEVPGGVIDITLITMVLLRNPGRPNGGLYARFAPIYQEVTGINPVSPERTDVLYGLPPDTIAKLANGDTSGVKLDDLKNLQVILNDANGKPMVITIKADATWEYDLLSDAPVTANPIAWANSAMSSMMVLTYGSELLGAASGDPNAGVGVVGYVVPTGEYDAGAFYATLTTEHLPLLAPMRAVAGLLSIATGEDVNTPVADALEPVLKLLVDTSYTDVERNPDGTWSRTLKEMHKPTLFGTQTINRTQAALLAGDIVAELGKGVGSEYTDVVQRVTNRVVNFLEDNNIQVPAEIKAAAVELATDPGSTIKTVSRQTGNEISKVLTSLDGALPDDPAPLTQKQLADIQRPIGKGLAETNNAIAPVAAAVGVKDPAATVKKIESDTTKQLLKTQKSLAGAQQRIAKVTDKLKNGDLSGAAKQVGENAKNRIDRVKKDINNGLKKLKGDDN